MTTVSVTGRTFEHRDLLRSLGGRFDKDARQWLFDRLTDIQLDRLRSLVGCVTNDPPPQSFSFTALDIPRRAGNSPSAIYGDDPTWHNHFADQNPSAFFGFTSLGRMIDYLDRIAPAQQHDSARAGWERDDGDGWRGSRSMADAIRLAREGWSDGLEAALAASDRLSVANPRVRQRRASLAGGTVNVGAMLAGNPAHMIRRPKAPGRKVVTFFVEAGCGAYVKADSMVKRAALIGATIDIMENAGYSCSIVAVDTSVDFGRPRYQLAVQLKDAGERLNLADVMFALGHPAFLRRFSFATLASVPETQSIWLSQGSPSNSFDDDHRCGPSEFYVPVLGVNQRGDDPLELLADVIPDGLPVEIRSV